MHGGFVVAAVKTGLRIVDALAGEDHLLLHQQQVAVAILEHVSAERCGRTRADLMLVIDHAHFQRRGAPENILGARRVLHAGQLHHHAIHALLLDHRLGHAQLVHAIAQGQQVLLHGRILNAPFGFRFERRLQHKLAASLFGVQRVVVETLLDFRFALAARLGIAELHQQHIAFAADAGISNLLIAQRAADIAGRRFQRLAQRGVHVNLQQEMHTAAQIQAEIHR